MSRSPADTRDRGGWVVAVSCVLLVVLLLVNEPPSAVHLDSRYLQSVIAILAALALAVVLGALGWTLLASRIRATPSAMVGASLLTGMAVLSLPVLAVSMWGHLSDLALAAILLVAGGIGSIRADSGSRVLVDAWQGYVHLWDFRFGRLLLVLQTGLGMILVLVALSPVMDWDSLMYHLPIPMEVAASGSLDVPIDNLHIAFIGAFHMVAVVSLAVGTVNAIPVLSVIAVVATVVVMAGLVEAEAGSLAARFSPLLAVVTTPLLLVGVTAQADAWLVLASVTSVALLIPMLSRSQFQAKDATVLGGLLGTAIAVKLVGGLVALGVGLTLAWAAVVGRIPWRSVLVVSATGAVFALPWLVKNLVLLGDPIYPFLGGLKTSPWLASLGVSAHLDYWVPSAVRGEFNLLDWILRPARLTVEASGRYQGLSLLTLIGIGVAVVRPGSQERREVRVLIFIGVVEIVAAILLGPVVNLRYLLPGVAIMAIAASDGLGYGFARDRKWSLAIVVLAVLALIPSAAWLWNTAVRSRAVGVVLGVVDTQEWSTANPEISSLKSLDRSLQQMKATRPILLFEARSAMLTVDVLQDNLFTSWQYLSTLPAEPCLDLKWSSHLVVNRSTLRYLIDRGMSVQATGWESFESYAARCLEHVESVKGYDIYAVPTQ